jgi:hypothetical protein
MPTIRNDSTQERLAQVGLPGPRMFPAARTSEHGTGTERSRF